MRSEPFVLNKFGGWSTATVYGSTIEDNELSDATNVFITDENTIIRRRGFRTLNTISSSGWLEARNLIRFETSTLISLLIATSAGTALVATSGTLNTNNATLTNTEAAVQFNELAYIFSPTTNQMATVNSAGSFTTNVANVFATCAVVHKRRIFTANNLSTTASDLSKIRYSEVYDIGNFTGTTGWPTTNTVVVNEGDGDFIVNIVELNDALIIFKTRSTWVLYTDGSPSNWTLKRLHHAIGCGFRDSPVLIKGLLYFQSPNEVYRTDGTSFEEISIPLKDVFSGYSAVSASNVNRGSGWYWGGLYILNPSPASQLMYVFNTTNDTWSRWSTPVPFSKFLVYETSTFYEMRAPRYRASGTGVELWEMGTASIYADGPGTTPYTSTVDFKPLDFGKPNQWKRVLSTDVEIAPNAGSTTLTCYSIAEPVGITTVTQGVTRTSNTGLHRFLAGLRCRNFKVSLETSDVNPVEIVNLSYNLLPSTTVGKRH